MSTASTRRSRPSWRSGLAIAAVALLVSAPFVLPTPGVEPPPLPSDASAVQDQNRAPLGEVATYHDDLIAGRRIVVDIDDTLIEVGRKLSEPARTELEARLTNDLSALMKQQARAAARPPDIKSVRVDQLHLEKMFAVIGEELHALHTGAYLVIPDGAAGDQIVSTIWNAQERYHAYLMAPMDNNGERVRVVFLIDFHIPQLARIEREMDDLLGA